MNKEFTTKNKFGSMENSYFVEGIQGAGKTTMVAKLAKENPSYNVYREGDYCPVELAWCAFLEEEQYRQVLEKYKDIADLIREKTIQEDDKKVVMYTRILTDIPGFHKDLERYEIYNGNKNREEFQDIVLKRFSDWNGQNSIFECALFQNIIENMILFLDMSDDEIVTFYRKVKECLSDKDYEIVYLQVNDVKEAEEIIRKERSDDQGNELWFPMMVAYLENSPHGIKHELKGMEGLVTHLEHRVALELRILQEVFPDNHMLVERTVQS